METMEKLRRMRTGPVSINDNPRQRRKKMLNNFIFVTRTRDPDRLNPVHYFRVFLNFAFFFCYIPFRLVKLPNESYIVKCCVLQQFICAINHILALSRFLTAIRETNLLDAHWNPSMYFELARNFATSVYMFTFVFIFWTKKKLFLRIFAELQHYQSKFRTYRTYRKNESEEISARFQVRTTTFILCVIYTLISTLNVVFGAGVIEFSTWSPKWLLRSYAGQGKFMFFLQNNKTAVPWEEFSPLLFAFTGTQILIQFYFKIGAHYADLSILVAVLTLRNLASHFYHTIKYENVGTSRILEHYYALKKLAKSINLAIGPVTLCAILEAMPYYATHIGDILFLPDWWGKFRYIFFVINFFSILIIAADTTHKVGEFKEWLSQDYNSASLTHSKLVVLLNEMSTNAPIGLSAMGLLTITYGFIGTLVSVVITYAVIILQFKSSVSNCRMPLNSETVE